MMQLYMVEIHPDFTALQRFVKVQGLQAGKMTRSWGMVFTRGLVLPSENLLPSHGGS